jgi:hypothetical protein
MSPSNKSATARLAKAREDHAAVKRHIEGLDRRLRAALIADADGAAAVAYNERREAREFEERLALKIELLEPLAGRELFRDVHVLSDPEARRRVLTGYEDRLRWALAQGHRDEAEVDRLRAEIAFLKQAA